MDTETIDRLFLELSQFTSAKTEREIRLENECQVLLKAVSWALGEEADFPPRPKSGGLFWWRKELRKRAGLRVYAYKDRRIMEVENE